MVCHAAQETKLHSDPFTNFAIDSTNCYTAIHRLCSKMTSIMFGLICSTKLRMLARKEASSKIARTKCSVSARKKDV